MQRQILRWMHTLLLSSLLVTLGVWGQVVVQNSTTKPVASNTTIQSPTDAGPREATKDVQSYKLPPETYQKAIAYSRARYWAYFIGSAYFLVILVVLLRCRIAPRLRDTAMRASSRYAVLLFALLFYVASRRARPSHRFIWAMFGGARDAGWFYFWLVAVPIHLFIFFIQPLLIDPLFNKFEPLQTTHPELVPSIEKALSHAGLTIPRDRMFLMKASEKTKQVDAYLTGLGASKRVVIWDTIIAAEPGPLIMHTLGHELGHYVLGHIWRRARPWAIEAGTC